MVGALPVTKSVLVTNFGVIIVNVAQNSAADKAGLKPGDFVIQVNNEKIDEIIDIKPRRISFINALIERANVTAIPCPLLNIESQGIKNVNIDFKFKFHLGLYSPTKINPPSKTKVLVKNQGT